MKHILFFLACLLVPVMANAQSFSFQFEPPFVHDFEVVPADLQPGSVAVYEVSGKEKYKHTVRVLESDDQKDASFVRMRVMRDVPKPLGMRFTLPSKEPKMENARKVAIYTDMGEMSTNGLLETASETITKRSKEMLLVLGKEYQVERLDFTAGPNRKGTFWTKKGLGPLGVAKAEIHKGEEIIIYTLASYVMKADERVAPSKEPSSKKQGRE